MRRVGFWLRFAAALVDTALAAALCLFISGILRVGPQVAFGGAERQIYLLILHLTALAYMGTEALYGVSVGKLAVGLRIANLDGTPATRDTLVLRWFTKHVHLLLAFAWVLTGNSGFYVLAGCTTVILFIGCLYMLCEDKQAWHDQWADTAVFRRNEVAAAA